MCDRPYFFQHDPFPGSFEPKAIAIYPKDNLKLGNDLWSDCPHYLTYCSLYFRKFSKECMSHYSMMIQGASKDQLFRVTIPEFEDRVVMPCTYGKIREEAIQNGEGVIDMYLEAWQAENLAIPQPRTLQAV